MHKTLHFSNMPRILDITTNITNATTANSNIIYIFKRFLEIRVIIGYMITV